MKHFKLTASIIGPYLPETEIRIGKFIIKKISSPTQSNFPVKPSVRTKNEALIQLSQEIVFHSDYYAIWHADAHSSKAAYEQGKSDLNYLLSCLELPVSSYKYFAKIIRIDYLSDENGPDPESASSEPIHVLSYVPSNLLTADAQYYEFLLLTDVQEIRELITKFYEGIKSEILGQGDSNLKYYKLLEEVSSKTLKRLKEQGVDKEPDYREILENIKLSVTSQSTDKVKVKKVKKFLNELRALNHEQISERIILTARKFGMTEEVVKTLGNVNKYRARVIAHPGDESSDIKLEDSRDVREMARLFIMLFISKFYGMLPPDYTPVKENDSWYQYCYSRSDAKQ